MQDSYYAYKKEVDWSLLHQGFSIPLDIQVIFQKNIQRFISRGQTKKVNLIFEGISYQVQLVNQQFDEKKYSQHKDILQIRYNAQSELAVKFRAAFFCSYNYLREQRENLQGKPRRLLKAPHENKEYLAIYTTEYEDTYLVEAITNIDAKYSRDFFSNEDEQKYESDINYPTIDPTSSVETIQQISKIRRLNRAIGDNLKMLYGYNCQICGENFGKKFDTQVVEAHHIESFVVSMNNDAANQIIICPNHHRVIHKADPVFYRSRLSYVYANGVEEPLRLNKHLLGA